ncbi:hypothetical protein A2716_04915 [candidate division WWE3 bacterium RIFCSPHIGHO2_01_FULL_40_23]|uniref:Lipid II isoglutaminyl synthase (glutamine-hydrolyzing) subunit GatD n=1 Tax=candidate division WWE3 bacterium RIFCSPLOWO2_01_FULL_41_18 TaxID=1802625 RepID=A0A1F4VDA9_UNCKA|nr:MAG: hypothetical protein A2716_04915 [candidate division WWE3 bacterium RIFCSPHIGHO2_01_FULL_40_23]OGC55211.1 MAG: hypothetical protein A3A78_04525 [candidate division WWE3 bacterium RIFCSPLOWO2_01_FULL_41_18]
MNLKLNHLYSQNLNIYGDLGNIIAFKYKAEKAGINLYVSHTEIGEEISEADIYFIGGGQDQDQILVYEDLLRHKGFILNEVEKGKVFLLICGGYQLFGKYFVDGEGNALKGLSILDLETNSPDSKVSSRCIGNIVAQLNSGFIKHWDVDASFSKYIVGFENHGGQTKLLTDQVKPIGEVIKGFGNNSTDKVEGCFYKNIIGSYMHGSFLPKNPHITNAILKKALLQKYNDVTFENLYEGEEKKAHQLILMRSGF